MELSVMQRHLVVMAWGHLIDMRSRCLRQHLPSAMRRTGRRVRVRIGRIPALTARLEKDISKAEKEIKGLAGRLGNPNFADKAPPEVVAECKSNLAEAEAQADLARKRLADLS